MTNKEPIIKVKSELKRISSDSPYIKDVVCVIGGFETDQHRCNGNGGTVP